MRGLRNAFFTGLLLSMPLAITIYVVRLLVDLASKPLRNHVMELVRHLASKTDANMQVQDNFWVEQFVVLLSALLVVAAITIIGWFSRYFLGRLLINSLETIIERVPMIKSVYASIKQIVSTFGSKNKANFKQVVLVQFPHAEARFERAVHCAGLSCSACFCAHDAQPHGRLFFGGARVSNKTLTNVGCRGNAPDCVRRCRFA